MYQILYIIMYSLSYNCHNNYIIICVLRVFSACLNTTLYFVDIRLTRVFNEHNGQSMVRVYII
jgi:hypothetical protein